jgi:hypothetical protein
MAEEMEQDLSFVAFPSQAILKMGGITLAAYIRRRHPNYSDRRIHLVLFLSYGSSLFFTGYSIEDEFAMRRHGVVSVEAEEAWDRINGSFYEDYWMSQELANRVIAMLGDRPDSQIEELAGTHWPLGTITNDAILSHFEGLTHFMDRMHGVHVARCYPPHEQARVLEELRRGEDEFKERMSSRVRDACAFESVLKTGYSALRRSPYVVVDFDAPSHEADLAAIKATFPDIVVHSKI